MSWKWYWSLNSSLILINSFNHSAGPSGTSHRRRPPARWEKKNVLVLKKEWLWVKSLIYWFRISKDNLIDNARPFWNSESIPNPQDFWKIAINNCNNSYPTYLSAGLAVAPRQRDEEREREIKASSLFVFHCRGTTCRGASAASSRSCEPIPPDKTYTGRGWAGRQAGGGARGGITSDVWQKVKMMTARPRSIQFSGAGPGEPSSVSITAAGACPASLSALGFQLRGN